MIHAVKISGLRGIREGSLANLTPLTVFVGPNGSGKSTLLEAILICSSPTTIEAIDRAVRRHSGGSREARWLVWKALEARQSHVTVYAAGDCSRTCRFTLDRASMPEFRSFQIEVEDNGPSSTGKTTTVMSFLVKEQIGSCDRPIPIKPLDDVREVRLVEARAGDHQTSLPQLYTKAIRLGYRADAKDIIRKVVPGAVDVEIATEGDIPVLDLVFDNYSVPASLAGDGVQSVLRVSLELATGPGGLVLLEEPEIHQHPGAIRQTARAILTAVQRDVQVVLTTHSLELIDAILAESTDEDLAKLSVYGFRLQDGALTTSRLDGPDVAFARTQIEDDLR